MRSGRRWVRASIGEFVAGWAVAHGIQIEADHNQIGARIDAGAKQEKQLGATRESIGAFERW